MRDFKFRGWDENHKTMYPNVYFDDLEVWRWNPENSELEILGDVNPGGMLIHIEVMQYTGIKDENGIEIFEGDILEASIYSDENPQVLPVEYRGASFLIDYQDSESDCVPVDLFVGSLSVVGNIYENPGLIV